MIAPITLVPNKINKLAKMIPATINRLRPSRVSRAKTDLSILPPSAFSDNDDGL